jgi:hypothetical protein
MIGRLNHAFVVSSDPWFQLRRSADRTPIGPINPTGRDDHGIGWWRKTVQSRTRA